MRKTRFGAMAASAALASATILGGAGIASAQDEAQTDSITGGGAKVTATASDNCEVAFEFVAPTSGDELDSEELNRVNWVVDYRVGEEEPTIPNEEDHLSVYNPVVASNQESVDGLNDHEEYTDFDVELLENTVNLNDVVEANETGEHTVTFKFYRGSAEWDNEETNLGEVTVTGCDTADDGFLGSVVGSVDVFGSLEGIS